MRIKQFSSAGIAFCVACSIFAGCSQQKPKGTGAIKKEDMNLSVKPGEDFFEYSHGTWMKNTPIPEDKSRYGAFDILREEATEAIHRLLEETAKVSDAPEGSNVKKIQDFYSTGMDVAKVNETGYQPLLPEFELIDEISNPVGLRKALVHLHKMGISSLFGIGVEADLKNTEVNRMYLAQDGITLPDRDYYTNDDENSKRIRKEYLSHLSKMFLLIGEDAKVAEKNAKRIMALETRMAHSFNTRLENRNYPAQYNPKSVEVLNREYSNFDWKAYFDEIGVEINEYVIVMQPKYIAELNRILKEESLADIRLYLKWRLLDESAGYLNAEIDDQNFAFFGTVLSGAKEQQLRWKRISERTSDVLGEAVGQLYVERYFPPEAKHRMNELVENLKKALRVRIENLEWMSEPTKDEALAKLDAFGVKIGYPDKWEDYSKLVTGTDSYVQNMWRANRFEFDKNMEELGKPVDTEKWGMTPQTVNAYYHPLLNEIVFPAAILQPPFFYLDGDDAVNYGAIGVVIGHEMTHGFDDSGRRFNKDGNMKDWWTKEDAEKFEARAEKLVEQFNGFNAIDDMHLDGKLTLGENIADYGGLTVALEAYRMALNGLQPVDVDGFNHMQRFFLSYAKVWRGNIRDKELKRRLKEDVHSPGRYRVNGGLFNIPEFYSAFEIDPQDALYRSEEQRAEIW